eukprot:CAMPEP_0201592084 /NCGR_PEP_ID=MMETSP0190_2-20130828/190075_1 /ASSEMBLY_ACC=CAM_ASM_000263 /TAXON_ID=37353 /ORGANISM="Rosalina sp." /LENGTH=94 /DNA_ID=CAMNT_0048050691 /DNA_START=78 /DNA_END=363 /DNA_ORIENTATION=+
MANKNYQPMNVEGTSDAIIQIQQNEGNEDIENKLLPTNEMTTINMQQSIQPITLNSSSQDFADKLVAKEMRIDLFVQEIAEDHSNIIKGRKWKD